MKPIYKKITLTKLTRIIHPHDKIRTQVNDGNNSKCKGVATGDSMLNGINERGLSKYQNVKIQNFPRSTTETITYKH